MNKIRMHVGTRLFGNGSILYGGYKSEGYRKKKKPLWLLFKFGGS